MFDIVIIGAGIIGSMIARELSRYQLSVAVIEKENDVGNKTTNANSAIIHSGYDPEPGTNKAKFNVLGNKMYDQIADELDVPFKRIGSLTVALYDEQLPLLEDLKKRAEVNGVNVQLLSKEEVKKLEPNISDEVKGALLAPTAGIIDPFNLCVHTMENAIDNGVKLSLSTEVKSIKKNNEIFEIYTNNGAFEAKIIINAAGVSSANVASMIEDIDWSITPRKGEYYVLDHSRKLFVNHTIFPLPSIKGKGILVSPTTSDNYIVGPSSEPVNDFDDVSTDSLTLNNIKEQASNMVNNIPFGTTIRQFAGLRATCSRHDFIIESAKTEPNFINVAGIESPGLVSSPAIAKYVVEELIGNKLILIKNPNFNPRVKRYIKSSTATKEEISNNPELGQLICSCENVSLAEIKDILSRSCPPHSIKGVKRRTRAGFGLCQGGFCQSKILLLLAKHYGVSPLDIPYDDNGSYILKEEVKDVK